MTEILTNIDTLQPVFEEPGLSLFRDDEQIVAVRDLDSKLIVPSDEELAFGVLDTSDIAFDISACSSEIKKHKNPWDHLGFMFIRDGSRDITITPSNTRLNELRKTILSETGIHNGLFVDFSQKDTTSGFIDPIDFAKLLAKGQIPMTTELPLLVHDVFFHRLGYTVMCQQIFDRFVDASREALEANEQERIKKIISRFDHLSGTQSVHLGLESKLDGGQYLATLYREFMPPIKAGLYAFRDVRAQRRTARALIALN